MAEWEFRTAGGPVVVAAAAVAAVADSGADGWEEGDPVGLSWGAGWWAGRDEDGLGGRALSWVVKSR